MLRQNEKGMSKKKMTEFREVKREELTWELFEKFRRRQVVRDCLRREDGKWVVKPAPFIDQWSREDYQFLVQCLRGTLDNGGAVFGAFLEGRLKGFASVEGKLFGQKERYLDLTSLHVSEELRGQGMGKKLFGMAALWAKSHGAEKLYISSHSAVETQRFYETLGCVDARECSKEHVRREPYDRQLEFDLSLRECTNRMRG